MLGVPGRSKALKASILPLHRPDAGPVPSGHLAIANPGARTRACWPRRSWPCPTRPAAASRIPGAQDGVGARNGRRRLRPWPSFPPRPAHLGRPRRRPAPAHDGPGRGPPRHEDGGARPDAGGGGPGFRPGRSSPPIRTARRSAPCARRRRLTFEFENVPGRGGRGAQAAGADVAPGARALAVAPDRVDEKTFLMGWRSRRWTSSHCQPVADLERAAPAWLARAAEDAAAGTTARARSGSRATGRRRGRWATIGGQRRSRARRLQPEISVMRARPRRRGGHLPLCENHHEGGSMRRTTAPAGRRASWPTKPKGSPTAPWTGLEYVGVLAVRCSS